MDYQIVFTAPKQAELLPRDLHAHTLAPDEVEGPTLMTLVSPGTELANWCASRSGYPFYPGYAAIFTVQAVGSAVTDLAPGDLAYCSGPHASWQRQARRDVIPLPAKLDPARAVCARLMGVSMSTLLTTPARPPALIAVTGLGPVGHLAAQLFQACGYDVLAVDPIHKRREWAQSVGIKRVAERLPVGDEPLAGECSLVVECSGHEAAVYDACRTVRKRGEVVLVGVPWSQQTSIPAYDILDLVFFRYVVLRSGWEWEIPVQRQEFVLGSIMENYRGAMAWLADGRIIVDHLMHRCSPADPQSWYQRLLQHNAPNLLTLFEWTQVG